MKEKEVLTKKEKIEIKEKIDGGEIIEKEAILSWDGSNLLLRVPKDADKKKEEATKKKIMSIYGEVKKKGASFEELAKKHSEDPSGKRGGDLDFFSRERMVTPFADAAFNFIAIGER